jgi:hypothetical protein
MQSPKMAYAERAALGLLWTVHPGLPAGAKFCRAYGAGVETMEVGSR